MAKKHGFSKFVVPAALALGKRAITRWPILAAAIGGALVHRLWTHRRMRLVSGTGMDAWTAKDATNGADATDASAFAQREPERSEPWSPTAPTGA
jgi:hypothetical protein